nr:hypothetical protein [uncultured Allomuricauda sp.]
MTTKRLKSLLLFLLLGVTAFAQESNTNAYPLQADVQTLDGILKAYYDVISGPAEQPRDWERDTSLHHPDALITITGKDKNKNPYISTQTLSEYHKSFGVPKKGFWEYEISRETQTFGNITHVWSTYETKEEKNGSVTQRGINSIQLYHDGTRWWILSWMFDSERTDNPIPKKYQ